MNTIGKVTSTALAMSAAIFPAHGKGTCRLSWESKNKAYEHFTDVGHYLLMMKDADASNFEGVREFVNKYASLVPPPACTATAKRNRKGEVIIGRNMDHNTSQVPAVLTKITGGKHEVLSIHCPGPAGKYKYDQLDALDKNAEFLKAIPFLATDAMNDAGLYVEVNMREYDPGHDFLCKGTNPGKPRASLMTAVVLTALNCATVDEALAFLKDSYDWYALHFVDDAAVRTEHWWNIGMVIGDARGDYGLVEFAKNGIYYTPYANGQGNYYINPELAEFAVIGNGFGRFAAALKGLAKCETEQDMADNMKNCWKKNETLRPGSLGYSDFIKDVNIRRTLTRDELQRRAENYFAPYRDLIEKYYSGDEKGLRDNATIWTSSMNFGVNCATKHLILRLWENDGVVIDWQW